jgi:hypothetical protein
LREEIKVSNEALRQELTHNLRDKISKELRIESQKGMETLKQDLKKVNLQQGLGNFKREIKDDLQRSLVLITQHQEENFG